MAKVWKIIRAVLLLAVGFYLGLLVVEGWRFITGTLS